MADIITTKRDTEIGRLLERVIRDHRKDISAYSKGHLNENNLFKPAEAGRSSWKTAKLPAIKLKNPVKIEAPCPDNKMWEAVACFSAGSPFKTDLGPEKPDSADHEQDPINDNINLEEFDASYLMLPKSDTYQIVPSVYGCITKRDEVKQRLMMDKQIVEKHNLTDRGWYNGSRATQNIKQDKPVADSTSIQAHCKLWDDVKRSCTIYNPLLSNIKLFYDGYLEYLQQKHSQLTLSTDNANSPKSKELSERKREIDTKSKVIKKMEDNALQLISNNDRLKNEFEVTEAVLSEMKLATEEEVATVCQSDSTNSLESVTIASNIEGLRREILQKRAEIQLLYKKQKLDMVPMEVYQCMIQCVQSAEVELQKQHKNIETLDKKKTKYGEQLDELFDNMELSAEQRDQLTALLDQTE